MTLIKGLRGGFVLRGINTYHKAAVIKTMYYIDGRKGKYTYLYDWYRIENQ